MREAMQKWEYEYLLIHYAVKGTIIEKVGSFEKPEQRELMPYLNFLGVRGWEIITINGGSRPEAIFLKRQLP